MQGDRRKQMRRATEEFLAKVVEYLRVIEKISEGEDIDSTEHYAQLVGLKHRIGRRREDHRIAELLCSIMETLASTNDHQFEKDRIYREVKVTKASGKIGSKPPSHSFIEGFEAEPPRVGKRYEIFTYDGGILSTSPVTEVKPGSFRTKNSLYLIDILQ